jgi:hypothetical protein
LISWRFLPGRWPAEWPLGRNLLRRLRVRGFGPTPKFFRFAASRRRRAFCDYYNPLHQRVNTLRRIHSLAPELVF